MSFLWCGGRREEQVRSGYKGADCAGLTPEMQLEQLTKKIHAFTDRQYTCLSRSLIPLLRQNGIFLLKPEGLNDEQEAFVEEYFRSVLFPVLTPLAVDRAVPSPCCSIKA